MRTIPLAALFLSTVAFAGMGLLVRVVSADVDHWLAVFTRSAVGIAVFLGWWLLRRRDWPRPRRVGLLLLRGTLGFASLALYFYGIAASSATDAIVLTYAYPVFAALFGRIFLGEPLQRLFPLAAVMLVVGLFLQARGFSGDWRAWAAGLTSAVTAGLAVVTVRECRKTEATTWIVFAFVAVSTFGSAVPALGRSRTVSPDTGVLLVGAGLCGTVGQLLMTWAYKYATVASAAFVSVLTILETAVFESLFLTGVWPDLRRAAGILLVVGSVWVALRREVAPPREPLV